MATALTRAIGALLLLAPSAHGGGSGLNIVVVVNQASTNSVRLGNYYCEKREVPPQNVLRINWTGGNAQWTPADFTNHLVTPLREMLSARSLTNQVDYVLLSMDIPYRVEDSAGANSTTSALFYGFKPDGPNGPWYLAPGSSNSYAGSESIFRSAPPSTGGGPFFLAMMLTASNLPAAQMVIDQGVASDGTFPAEPVVLAKSDDRLRNVRYALFEDAIFDARLYGRPSLFATNTSSFVGLGRLLGYGNGTDRFATAPEVFVPGAMADNMTSFGGILFEPNDQTTLLDFLSAGASGSYGTVVEPSNWLQKFPAPRGYFYQARGFTLAESYYQSVTNPFQGLLVGEPLAAPFAEPAQGGWTGLPPGALLSGTTNLTATFTAANPRRTLQSVDLFLDGVFLQTVTNVPPQPGNAINVTLNGRSISHTVMANASLKQAAVGLATALNTRSAQTRVQAFARGDRVELRGLEVETSGAAIPLAVSTSMGAASALTMFASANGESLLDTTAQGVRAFTITNVPALGDYLQMVVIKTNGETVVVGVTNTTSGTTLAVLAKSLFAAVGNTPTLQGQDGVLPEEINMHEDFPYNVYVYGLDDHSGEFNIRARGPGWERSQVRVCVRGSSTFRIEPAGTNRLNENLGDLQPRGHIYLSAGVTNLPVTLALNTASLPDGFHELTAVGCEGTHVRTQKRVSQTVLIRNTSLSASLLVQDGASNTVVGTTLRFLVAASGAAVAKTELFSTGGSLERIVGEPNAEFVVPSAALGVGLHPVYALVTASDGKQFRTQTQWVRILGGETPEPPLRLAVDGPPIVLSWPATVGRAYEVQSTTDLATPFTLRETITATNSPALWAPPTPVPAAEFYRVRAK
jgi:uncharacterized protein (TIGR03790 family)